MINSRMLMASLAAFVISFLWGWLLWDVIGLMDYYSKHSTAGWNALFKMEENMNWIGLILANLFTGLLVGWVCWKTSSNSLMAGFMTAAIVGALFACSMDMMFYSLMNVYTDKMIVVVDVLVNAVSYGVAGAVAGAVLGMGSKKAA